MSLEEKDPYDPASSWQGPVPLDFVRKLQALDQTIPVSAKTLGHVLHSLGRMMSCQFYAINATVLSDGGMLTEADKTRKIAQHNFGVAADAIEQLIGSIATDINKMESDAP